MHYILQNFLHKESKNFCNFAVNCFDTVIWKQYTNIEDLFVKISFWGSIHIKICEIINAEKKIVVEKSFSAKDSETAFIPIDLKNVHHFLTVEVALKDDAGVHSIAYTTTTLPVDDIKINYVICTYKREGYVLKNKDIFHSYKKKQQSADIVTIVDNGDSLPQAGSDSINIIPNKNMGGTGGFIRGIYETLHGKLKDAEITHISLMDDDIELSEEMFIRNRALVEHLNEDVHIGAAMHPQLPGSLESSKISCFGHKYRASLHPSDTAIGVNLPADNIVSWCNKLDRNPDSTGWWWHCFSVEAAKKAQLLFPFFVKMDDVHYALKISATGSKLLIPINFWVKHDDFETKYSAAMQYYRFRNRWILLSFQEKMPGRKAFSSFFIKELSIFLIKYRYEHAQLLVNALKHFLKGPDYIVKDYTKILQQTLQTVYYEKARIVSDKEIKSLTEPPFLKEKKLPFYSQVKTALKGLFLPAHKEVLVNVKKDPGLLAGYRASKIFYYNPEKKCGYHVNKSIPKFCSVLFQAGILLLKLFFAYKSVINEYKSKEEFYSSEFFWEDYFKK